MRSPFGLRLCRAAPAGSIPAGTLLRGVADLSRLQKWQSENINENTSADFLSRSPLSNDAEIAPAIGNYFWPHGAVPGPLVASADCKGQQALLNAAFARARTGLLISVGGPSLLSIVWFAIFSPCKGRALTSLAVRTRATVVAYYLSKGRDCPANSSQKTRPEQSFWPCPGLDRRKVV